MEIAATATTTECLKKLKTANILATSIVQKDKNTTQLWPSTKPNILSYTYNNTSKILTPILSLTHCSNKPDTNTNNETDPNCTIQSRDPLKPTSKDSTFSSSLPSSATSRGLVLDLGPKGSWDSLEIGSPVVKRFLGDEEERWYMWYHGGDSLGLAVSSNGVHWERGLGQIGSSGDVGLVMKCGSDWWAFDTLSIRPSEVVIMSSAKVRASSAVYWLYYTGFSSEKVEGFAKVGHFELVNSERFSLDDMVSGNDGKGRIFKSLPGLAISQDGRHWARIEGEHHSGALFDVGCEGEWDSLFVSSPQVVFHVNGDLRMYYHSFDAGSGQFGIGIARSRDGIKWVKLRKVLGGGKVGSFDELGVVNPCVVKNKRDGKYIMAYEGVSAVGKRSIGLAMSNDGLKDWRRFQEEAVLRPSVGEGWDNNRVGEPCLVQMDGDVDEWRLYYTGVGDEGRTGIGMAVSQGNDFTCFRRWIGFQF